MMPRSVIAVILCFSLLSFQAMPAAGMDFYVEGMAGAVIPGNSETKSYTEGFNNSGVSLSGRFEALINWYPNVSSGVEVGVHNFGLQGLRVAAGISYFQLELNEFDPSGDGTVTVGNTTRSLASDPNFKRDDFEQLGVFDEEVWLFGPAVYYDMPISGTRWAPYLGVGGGLADVRNAAEATFYARATLGTNFSLTENLFLGLRTDYIRLGGYESEFGPHFKANDIFMVRLSAGWNF